MDQGKRAETSRACIIACLLLVALQFFLLSQAGGDVWLFGLIILLSLIQLAIGERRALYQLIGLALLSYGVIAGIRDYRNGARFQRAFDEWKHSVESGQTRPFVAPNN